MQELIDFLDSRPDMRGIQLFFTPAVRFNDQRDIIYKKDGITIKHCWYYGYIEILGLTEKQQEDFIVQTNSYDGCYRGLNFKIEY